MSTNLPTVLHTDGYKFSMAEAGWPLRRESFYYSHRKGGPHLLPFDPERQIRALLPAAPTEPQLAWLLSQGYGLGGAWRAAMVDRDALHVHHLPRGSWFFDREPAFVIEGPSALVSWLEPLVLQLNYRIQVATVARCRPDELPQLVGKVTCDEQRDIVLETLEAVHVAAPAIEVCAQEYHDHVLARVSELLQIVEDPRRIFEVGMRAASCMGQHRIALQACKEAGLLATSNGLLAHELGMKLVGTMGHEHVQRYGDDQHAFRAMRDRHPGPSSFLLDTFSTLDSGIPEAYGLIAEEPERRDSVRFDSGDKRSQFVYAVTKARGDGLAPRLILEDGFTDEITRDFEALRTLLDVPATDVLYGYGGHIVSTPWSDLSRDRVSAVYKLTQTGPRPTMKFGDEPGAGKESIPGQPVLHRVYHRQQGRWGGLVAQRGETVASEHDLFALDTLPRPLRFTAAEAVEFQREQGPLPAYSEHTRELVHAAYAARDRFGRSR